MNLKNWTFVSKTLLDMQRQRDTLYEAISGIMLTPESPIFETFWKNQDSLIAALALLIDDKNEALEWFTHECDFGSKPQEAGDNDEMRLIITHDDLKWLLELWH